MRVPFLILCVAVVYGACRTYGHEEKIDLTEEIQNNGDYKLDYANMPVERFLPRDPQRFLARHKRYSLVSPVTSPIDTALKLFGFDNGIIATAVDMIKFVFGAMTGQEDLCPKIDKLCLFDLRAILHPIETAKTVVCYIFQTIGSGTRALIGKVFQLSIQFFRNVFLPGLHTTLNTFNKTGLLPPQISALIKTFNVLYSILQITGYVPK